MIITQTRYLPLLVTFAVQFLGTAHSIHSTPSSHRLTSPARAPPPLPQYYASSQRPPSPPPPPPLTSSLAPTSPVYTAQRIRSTDSFNGGGGRDYDDDIYPVTSNLGTARTVGGNGGGLSEDAPDNTGFVEPIDFSSLLKDIGSSPKGVGLDIGSGNNRQTSPLFASESKDTFQGFFKDTKNPFEELSRLNTASSDQNSRKLGGDNEENIGFVDPNVQFRSLFDSAGASSGFGPSDFLGSKSENIGSAASKGSQTRAYPSFTYSGREPESEDSDYFQGGGGGGGEGGPNRYRSSFRQIGGSSNSGYYDFPRNLGPPPDFFDSRGEGTQEFDAYDRISHDSPSDSYDDDGRGNNNNNGYYNGPSPSYRGGEGGGSGGGDYDRPRSTPRYKAEAQETSSSPESKPRASESKKPRCKKIEKQIDYASEDHASFTEPDDDYDPSTYRGRYKRQARQRSRQGGSPRRPMTCYVCEDENGRYAEKCSYDSKGNPNNNGNYYHSESSSFSDNGRRPNYGGSGSKNRARRSGNRQRQSDAGGTDADSSESTTNTVKVLTAEPEIAESEAKVIDKRQSGGGYHNENDGHRGGGGGGRQGGYHSQGDGYADPYNVRTGAYQHPTGYEGPPIGSAGGSNPGHSGDYHSGGGGGGQGGGHGEGNDGFGGDDFDFGPSEYDREAASATREFDFSIPREFDPDVQLSLGGGGGRGGSGSGNRGAHHQPQSYQTSNRRSGPHASASNRRETTGLEDFDIGYNDYIRQHFPETVNDRFSTPHSSSHNPPSNYEFTPNYYHRPRGNDGNYQGETSQSNPPQVSQSPDYRQNHHRGYDNRDRDNVPRGGGRGERGGYVPDRDHTQPSHNFAPPPGFFSDSEDNPPYENYENLGNIFKEFSNKARDGCQQAVKGDMLCYVCRDAKGGNKEECMYASNDPKNTAMAYHEVSSYSSPSVSVLPVPHSASGKSREDSTIAAEASSVSLASTPLTVLIDARDTSPSVNTVKRPLFGARTRRRSTTTPSPSSSSSSSNQDKDKDKKKNKHSVKSTRIAHSSTVIVHERSKRSPSKISPAVQDEYDFDY